MFKTLNSEVETQLSESIYINETFNKYRYKFIKNNMINWTKNPICQSFKFALFFIFLSFVLTYLYKVLDLGFIIKSVDLLFNAQVTILALIFPLVIGFVGVLIKDEIANKSLWRIYSRYSGFMLVGINGILFLCSIIIFNLFDLFFSYKYYTNSLFLIFHLWFLFNLFLLAWLIYSTFEFVKIEKRNHIILEFAVNVVICNEVRKHLCKLIPYNAIGYKLLPNLTGEQKLDFIDFGKSNYVELTESLKKDVYVNNIYYFLLQIALKFWVFRNTKILNRRDLKLILPLTVNGKISKNITYALTNKDTFTWVEKLLIKFAYRISSKNRFDEASIENITDSLFNNVDKALNDNNIKFLESSLNELSSFVRVILEVTTFQNNNKKADNWLLLSKNIYWNFTLFNDIISEFYEFNRQAVHKTLLLKNKYLLNEVHSIYKYIYPNIQLPFNIVNSFLELHNNIWNELIVHIDNNDENFSDELYKSYIGSWEGWSYRREKDLTKFENCAESIKILHRHLILTCNQIILSIKNNNNIASIWAVNMLNNWVRNFFLETNMNSYYYKVEGLNCGVFNLNKNLYENFISFINHNKIMEEDISLENLYKIALENEWTHSRVITASYILNYSNLDNEDKNLIFALCNQQIINPYLPATTNFNDLKASKILEVYLLNENQYSKDSLFSKLSVELTEEFKKISQERMISGRSYGGIVVRGNDNILSSLKVLILCNSNYKFDLDSKIYDLFFCENLFSTQLIDNLVRTLETKFNVLSKEEIEKSKKLINCDDIESYVSHYNDSIDLIISNLKNKNEEIILRHDISESRLLQYKQYYSNAKLFKDKNSFPISLFKNLDVEKSLDESCKKVIELNNMNKRDLIEGDFNRSINEDEFSESLMNEQLYIAIFREIFNEITYEKLEFNTEEELLVELLRYINVDEEILLTGNIDLISYLQDFKWDKERKTSLKIEFRDIEAQSYICHINNIPLYRILYFECDFCLRLNRQVFDTVKYKEFEKDIFVDLEFIFDDEDNCNKGKFKITTYVEVLLNNIYRNYHYVLKKNDE